MDAPGAAAGGPAAEGSDPGVAPAERTSKRGSRLVDLAIVVGFVVPLLFVYGRVTLGGSTLVPYDALLGDPVFRPELVAAGTEQPQNGLVADLVFQNVVWKEYLAAATREGEAALWNPHILGGLPFFAGGQSSPLYPSTVLFLLLPAHLAYGWNALLTLWLAAAGMYAFGRTLGVGRLAAVVMGLAWSLSLLFVANTVFPMIQAAMAWTPVVLAGIEAVARRVEVATGAPLVPSPRSAAWLGLVALATAMAALAGHVEILYYAGMLCAAYALARGWRLARRVGARTGVVVTTWVAAAGLAGILLAGAQLVPFAELAGTSWRASAIPYEAIDDFAFATRQVFTFVVPDFFGNPAHHLVKPMDGGAPVAATPHTFWGGDVAAKNYVESAAYVGVLTLLLAAIGLLASRRWVGRFFAVFGAVALTFVFGLPTYRVLYELAPGFDQLRTPFRWVFPVMMGVVVLAGLGVDHLHRHPRRRTGRYLGWLALAASAAATGVLVAARLQPEAWHATVATALAWDADVHGAVLEKFPDVAAFASYMYWRASHATAFLLLGSLAVLALTGGRAVRRLGAALMVLSVVADLVIVGVRFNPAVDPGLATMRPPVVEWLQDAVDVRWGRIVAFGEDRLLWPNTAWRFGVPDTRGYDSIIPSWTVASLNAVEPQEGMLRFNRIGNFRDPRSVAHPMVNALGGLYVLTPRDVELPGMERVYDGEARVYRNDAALPRAWVALERQVVTDTVGYYKALDTLDPERTVLLDDFYRHPFLTTRRPESAMAPADTRVVESGRNHLVVEVFTPLPGMLVISDAWFPGWRAWVDYVAADEPGDSRRGVEVEVVRADGMLRAVPVPKGRSTVRLEYFPMSVKVGLYLSFLGLLALTLVAGVALWRRFAEPRGGDQVGRIAVNSAGPMAAALLNKVVDFAFAMLMLRILGPTDAGKWYTAIVIISFVEIFTNFGLNLLTTREVARRPEDAPVYLTQTSLLRLALWFVSLPFLTAYVMYRSAVGAPLGSETVLALGLLALSLIPSNLNAALTSIFQGFERMALPAGVTITSNYLRVTLGAFVLLAGYSFVGLAAVSIVVNWVTLTILAVLLYREGVRPALRWQPASLAVMAGVSLPFMLNHLLQTVFFKIDVLLLSQLSGDTVVGWYQAAYKWVDALIIIPGYFTMALFPLMSRQARDDRSGLKRGYTTSVRWLLSLALPVCLATTFLSEQLIRLLAGPEYLPAGAVALRVMIWFLPFSFANGLAQYVLLAMDRQRLVTPSFLVAVAFNVGANLWAIPRYGFVGAAVVTILSEVALLVPFSWGLRDLGMPPLVATIWRPALATSVMGVVFVTGSAVALPDIVVAAAAAATYLVALERLGGITAGDRRLLARLKSAEGGEAVVDPV